MDVDLVLILTGSRLGPTVTVPPIVGVAAEALTCSLEASEVKSGATFRRIRRVEGGGAAHREAAGGIGRTRGVNGSIPIPAARRANLIFPFFSESATSPN